MGSFEIKKKVTVVKGDSEPQEMIRKRKKFEKGRSSNPVQTLIEDED